MPRRTTYEIDQELCELAASHGCRWTGQVLHAPDGYGFTYWTGSQWAGWQEGDDAPASQELTGYTKTQQRRFITQAITGGFTPLGKWWQKEA